MVFDITHGVPTELNILVSYHNDSWHLVASLTSWAKDKQENLDKNYLLDNIVVKSEPFEDLSEFFHDRMNSLLDTVRLVFSGLLFSFQVELHREKIQVVSRRGFKWKEKDNKESFALFESLVGKLIEKQRQVTKDNSVEEVTRELHSFERNTELLLNSNNVFIFGKNVVTKEDLNIADYGIIKLPTCIGSLVKEEQKHMYIEPREVTEDIKDTVVSTE
jgi:hypothetical protein